MYSVALVLVILSGLIHSIWNLFTKTSVHKVVFLWLCQWVAIIVFLPFAVRELLRLPHPIPLLGLVLLFISALLHGVYVLLLAKTYAVGDLSQAYPIMRGTSPLLVPLLGVFTLGEHLPVLGWLGVISIVVGIFLISGIRREKLSELSSKVAFLALSVGFMITGYTVVDKLALHYIPPFSLNEATNVGNLLALSWIALRSGAIHSEWQVNWKTIILVVIMAPGGYILFLGALRMMPVSQIAPMREIGTVFGTLLGIFVLREAHGLKRIGASALIVLGVVLLS